MLVGLIAFGVLVLAAIIHFEYNVEKDRNSQKKKKYDYDNTH